MLRVVLSKEEGSGISDVARDEENFRSGLKRNIAQLSNLARVNREELARLREQVQNVHFCVGFRMVGLNKLLPLNDLAVWSSAFKSLTS